MTPIGVNKKLTRRFCNDRFKRGIKCQKSVKNDVGRDWALFRKRKQFKRFERKVKKLVLPKNYVDQHLFD